MKRTLVLLILCAALGSVQAADVQGGKDHPLVTRFPGSTLVGYFQRDWEQTTFPLSGEVDSDENLKQAVTVEGNVTRLVYLGPVGKSPLEVFRNYQQAFAQAGLKPKFSCSGNCGRLFFHWRFGKIMQAMKWTKDDLHDAADPKRRWSMDAVIAEDGHGVYGTISRGGREVHVFVYTSIAGYEDVNATGTVIEIAEPKPMQSGQVTVDASALGKGLASEGKIALYGIYFDTGKATLKPESDAQLGEMGKLLKAQPALNVFVVGHTDNVGGFDANVLLSKQRAEAVRDALVKKFGIAATRVTPYGVANVAPVSTNASEAGRALNRRVELVAR